MCHTCLWQRERAPGTGRERLRVLDARAQGRNEQGRRGRCRGKRDVGGKTVIDMHDVSLVLRGISGAARTRSRPCCAHSDHAAPRKSLRNFQSRRSGKRRLWARCAHHHEALVCFHDSMCITHCRMSFSSLGSLLGHLLSLACGPRRCYTDVMAGKIRSVQVHQGSGITRRGLSDVRNHYN